MGLWNRLSRSAAVFAALALVACGGDDDDDDGASVDTGELDVVIERVGEYDHLVADITYDRPAPSGGDHLPAPGWLNCGVYNGQVPDELAVHSLEHGAVWVALGPESTDADREAAAGIVDVAPGRVFVSDVPDLPSQVELVAWGVRLRHDRAADEDAAAFVEEYADASGAPEAGAACSDSPVGGTPPDPPPLPTQ